MPEKEFVIWLESGRILAWRAIRDGELIAFRVVLLVEIQGETFCVSRYDTAHGIPHQDILGLRGGTLAKDWFFDSSVGEVFQHAVHDLQKNAEAYIRFFREN